VTLPAHTPLHAKLCVLNTSGQLIQEKEIEAHEINQSFSLSELPSGLYWLQLFSDEGIIGLVKFVKE